MRNRTSSSSRAVDGRSLRAGKLLAGLQASQGEQRQSGNRRHESRRALGLPEAALALHTGTAVAWDLPTTTGATGGNPEAGRRGAKAWHPDGAGSIDPASGDAGSATQMGPDILRTQPRVPAETLGASSGSQSAAIHRCRPSLGGRPGLREILRPGQPRQTDGSDRTAGDRQESAPIDRGVLESGRAGERASESGGRRDTARWSAFSTPVEHRTRRTRPGTGTAQASLRAVCGRLQYLRAQPTSGTAGDDERHALSHATAPAQGERGQECSGSTSRADVLGVQLQQQQGTEAAHRAEGPVALQAENPGTDATDARNQSGTNAEGTNGLPKGLEELLRLLSDTLTATATGSMDTPSSAVHDLEAMEARPATVREATPTRGWQGTRCTNGG